MGIQAYLQWMQHEAQTRAFGGEQRRLVIALAAGRDIVHLRPDIGCVAGHVDEAVVDGVEAINDPG